jgi:hypothetical protein
MSEKLTIDELAALVRRVFAPTAEDTRLAVLFDHPDRKTPDRPAWIDRRKLALEWRDGLRLAGTGFESIDLYVYPNVHANNADLPEAAFPWEGETPPVELTSLYGNAVAFEDIFSTHSIVIALAELSATAPLKIVAPKYGLRAASMPGFSRAMIPALRLDFDDIQRRCESIKALLDPADEALFRWTAGGRSGELALDLRERLAVASGGVLRTSGLAGNLPSGETFIVPYEGERPGMPSGTHGTLPLQLNGELFFLTIDANRVTALEGDGPEAQAQRLAFEQEPAYANVAELGLGILSDYGVMPVGETLLDEKLGLHIAFGRSNHFPGGTVGPDDFSSPDKVVHIDYIYLSQIQPAVTVDVLEIDGKTVIKAGAWTI